jgi:hypothetical protein
MNGEARGSHQKVAVYLFFCTFYMIKKIVTCPILIPFIFIKRKVIKLIISYNEMPLLPDTYEISSNILVLRLAPYVDEITGYQYGFQCNRSTTDQIFCVHQMLKKKWEYNGSVYQLQILGRPIDSGEKYSTIFSLNLVHP